MANEIEIDYNGETHTINSGDTLNTGGKFMATDMTLRSSGAGDYIEANVYIVAKTYGELMGFWLPCIDSSNGSLYVVPVLIGYHYDEAARKYVNGEFEMQLTIPSEGLWIDNTDFIYSDQEDHTILHRGEINDGSGFVWY